MYYDEYFMEVEADLDSRFTHRQNRTIPFRSHGTQKMVSTAQSHAEVEDSKIREPGLEEGVSMRVSLRD